MKGALAWVPERRWTKSIIGVSPVAPKKLHRRSQRGVAATKKDAVSEYRRVGVSARLEGDPIHKRGAKVEQVSQPVEFSAGRSA